MFQPSSMMIITVTLEILACRNSWISGHLYPDRLWDNSGPSCVSGSTCCDNPNQPWFKKNLTQPANEDVEMRWCANESPVSYEATATTRVELYVRVV